MAHSNSTGSVEIYNSLFIGNKSGINGGSAITNSAPTTIINSTFGGNNGGYTIFTLDDVLLNNVVMHGNTVNGTEQIAKIDDLSTITVAYSAIEDLNQIVYIDNGGNINLTTGSLVFVNPQPATNAPTTAGNYRLRQYSPAINKGSNSIVSTYSLGLDFEGDPRIRLGTVDMGADESYYLPPEDVNLVTNGGFSLGNTAWVSTGDIEATVSNGKMNLSFPLAINGWLQQLIDGYALPVGAKIVAWVEISNPDPVTKTVQFMVRDSDLTNTYLCAFRHSPECASTKLLYALYYANQLGNH